MNLIRRLLETWSEPPCGAGPCPPWLVVLYHLANLVISACYLAIPATVLWYWRYRRDGISPTGIWMVLAFLPMQALSRAMRVDGIPFPVIVACDVLAAIVTLNSVIWLRPKILHILRLPSRQQLHDLNDLLQTKVLEIQVLHLDEREKNARLLAEVEKFRRTPPGPSEHAWILSKHQALDRIVEVIHRAG